MAKEIKHYDAVIIGAGLFGLSAAYELANSGKKVLVLDKGAIGGGASVGNARMSKKDPRAPIFNDLVDQSQQMIFKELNNEGGILTQVKCFDVFESTHPSRDVYKGLLEEQKTENPQSDFGVAPEKGKELYAYMEDTYVINPHALLGALQKKCIAWGCVFVEHDGVTQWDVQDARVLISTEQEKNYSADRLVIAAHGWSRELLAKGNIEPHPSFLESIYTKRAPIWQFEFPDGVIPAIGRSSLPGKPYLDVYYLPEYSEELEKVVMKVGLNSDKDRAQQYSSPNEIYLNPLLNQVNDAETLEVKRLVQEKFGIILGEPISRHVCCMTYSKTVAQEKFSLPVVGQFITKDSLVVPQVIGIFAGCGIGAKLSPAIGNIVRKGIETQWQGKEPQDKAIFEALSPGRFVRHEQSREMKQSFAEKLGHLKYGSRESVGLFG